MINPAKFLAFLIKSKIIFFSGVPDSLLKEFLLILNANKKITNITTSNEGLSVSLAAGYALSTNSIPLIYMQNSGLGNAINPIASLIHSNVYNIPVLFLIGWRGRPTFKDEPQHMVQGKITKKMLDLLDIEIHELSALTDYEQVITKSVYNIKNNHKSQAILVHENTFEEVSSRVNSNFNNSKLTREESIRKITNIFSNDIILSTTGKASRELYKIRLENKQKQRDFLTVGSMGHVLSIALGIALAGKNKEKKIICLDGDGSLIMHLGSIVTVGYLAPRNFFHILINNNCHESVGKQSTNTSKLNYQKLSKSVGYTKYLKITNMRQFESLKKIGGDHCVFIEIVVNEKSSSSLPRPKNLPIDNKIFFSKFINNE